MCQLKLKKFDNEIEFLKRSFSQIKKKVQKLKVWERVLINKHRAKIRELKNKLKTAKGRRTIQASWVNIIINTEAGNDSTQE